MGLDLHQRPTCDALMSTPKRTPLPGNKGLRSNKSADVITKLGEKRGLPRCQKMDIYGAPSLKATEENKRTKEQMSCKKGSLDPDDEPINCSHSSLARVSV